MSRQHARMEHCYYCGREFVIPPYSKHDMYCPRCREEQTARDNAKIKANMTNRTALNIATAVMEDVAKEYRHDIKKFHHCTNKDANEAATMKMHYWTHYFESRGFKIMSFGLNGRYLKNAILRDEIDRIRRKPMTKEEKQRLEKELKGKDFEEACRLAYLWGYRDGYADKTKEVKGGK